MHYHYFTLEQRDSLEHAIRTRLAGKPELPGTLALLRTPEYGVCADCESDIPYVRLLGNPVLRRCRACEARAA